MCQEGVRVLAQAGWDYRDILKHYYTGTEVTCTEPTAFNWYFAEGSTRPGIVTYICLGNPGESGATVNVRYLLDNGDNKDVPYDVPAHSRVTVNAATDIGAGKDFSCEVDSTNEVPVVAERPMYFNYHPASSGGAGESRARQGAANSSGTQLGWTGGHDTIGSTFLKPTWYFAEGTTRANFDTYFCIGNPSGTEAQITVNYLVEGGGNVSKQYTVGPRARKTVVASGDIGREKDFACVVGCSNGVGIVAERPMYFNYGGAWNGGHDALGSPSARPSWYFAEGTTRQDFATYLCLSNPTEAEASVKVSYLIEGGGNKDATYEVGPMTRKTITVSSDIGKGKDFSCRIISANNVGIVAERPMYFNYGSTSLSGTAEIGGHQGASNPMGAQLGWTGGSDTLGTSYPRPSWYFAEGSTRPNFVTYLCLANPTDKRAAVKITYFKGDGTVSQQDASVPPLSRTTITANDYLGSANDAAHDMAIKIETTNRVGIIAERPMYFNYGGSWTGGHVSMGFSR
jgi:hypothetical protein